MMIMISTIKNDSIILIKKSSYNKLMLKIMYNFIKLIKINILYCVNDIKEIYYPFHNIITPQASTVHLHTSGIFLMFLF